MAENETAISSGHSLSRHSARYLAALGLVTLALAGYWLYASSALVFRGERTSGVVTALNGVLDAQGRTLGFAPVIEYSDEHGMTFVYRSQIADNPAGYALGDYVPVYYDPANPQIAVVRGFRETFSIPLLIAILGSFFLLLAGITSKAPARGRRPPPKERTSDMPARIVPADQAARLQFHPFNAVAFKHYLDELKSTGPRKVKITDAAAALPEGRNPVALCEFLAVMASICYAKDAEAYVTNHCPHLIRPKVFKARNTQGLTFLFEGTAYIVLCPVDLDTLLNRLANATALRTGPHDLVPGDVIWKAAPRHTAFAKEWDAVRGDVEEWVKDVALKSNPFRPFIFSGHSLGGAMANIGAYEFAKRGRLVSGVVTFAGPPPGGQAFANEYNQLGLEERTLRLEFDETAPGITLLPMLYSPVGRVWRMNREVLPAREPFAPNQSSPNKAAPVSRSTHAAYSLQRRYGLALSTLIYQRLRELIGASGREADFAAAFNALSDHLAFVRGSTPDAAKSVFAPVKDLPVKVKDAADLEALKTAFPHHLI